MSVTVRTGGCDEKTISALQWRPLLKHEKWRTPQLSSIHVQRQPRVYFSVNVAHPSPCFVLGKEKIVQWEGGLRASSGYVTNQAEQLPVFSTTFNSSSDK